tara:strand:+ start:123 stop:1580 length:1458 start_codon:yes stop_codon:yes gene_type:complete
MQTGQCFIDGKWLDGSGDRLESLDPASGETVWSGAMADGGDVDRAFNAARAAFPQWARRPFAERRAIVEKFGALVADHKGEIAELISRETGKLLWDTQGEAAAMAGKIGISLKAYDDRTGETRSEMPFGRAELRHKPLGVMFVLGPYNFPAHLPNGHIVPALIAGNTVVFKPSELTPAVGQFMVRLWEEAGLPAGVLNFIPGGREAGGAALDHSELDGVLFTGSHTTGQFIHKKFAGRTGIQLALEMGGNNPLVIWDADNIDAAARMAVHSAYITTGQRCSCARRLIIPAGAGGDAIVDTLADYARRLPVAAWSDPTDAFMGPLVSAHAARGVLAAQADLIGRGANVLVEAQRLDKGEAFVSAGLLDVTGLDLPDEEVFGPLLKVHRAETFDAAMALANDTAYGLSAGLVSDDAKLWDRFWTESRAGIVNWNRPTPGAASSMPFGGPGQSGNLRPSAYYAADYCAFPVATQAADSVESLPIKGLE